MAVYEYNTRIRYSEVSPGGVLTHASLINLFQNCSTFQSEDIGYGVTHLKEKQRAWLLSSWQIVIDKMPAFSEKVTVKTWSYGIRRALGYRNFALCDAKGNILSYANSLWVYIDTVSGKPVSAPADEAAAYGASPQLEMECSPRKITLCEDMTAAESFTVPHYFIDTNQHVNNEKYILLAMEYLPQDYDIHEIRCDYRQQAFYGDIIVPKVHIDENHALAALYNDRGELLTITEFIPKKKNHSL